MCQKIPYPTKTAAMDDARFMLMHRRNFSNKASRGPKSGRKLRPYWCYYCDCWHLTTRRK